MGWNSSPRHCCPCGARARAAPAPAPLTARSPLLFMLKSRPVLQAIITRQALHQRAVPPLIEDPADIFPRNPCHGGEIALRDLLPNKDAALPDVTAERVGKA